MGSKSRNQEKQEEVKYSSKDTSFESLLTLSASEMLGFVSVPPLCCAKLS